MSDLIRREDAIAAATSCPDSHWGPWIAERLRALPAVQPDAAAIREAALREAAAMLTSGAMHGCDNPDEVLECADAILALIDRPAHVNETPKSEHDAANVLTPATKVERDD